MTGRAPVERNFRRARRTPGRRARFRIRVPWSSVRRTLVALVVLFALYQLGAAAADAPLLRVQTIAVGGNVRLSSGEVQALVEDLRGTSILTVDLDAFRRRLVESPWVADVALRRVLPSTIQVFVSERRPIGLCRIGEELYLVDETGTVIDQFGPQYAAFDLPIIDGLTAAGGGIDPGRAALAARALAALGRDAAVTRRLSQLDVTDPHDAVVLLEGDPALLHLGDDKFLERLHGYLELAGALRERVPDFEYADLRFDRRVYVRPADETPARGRSPSRPQAKPRD